MFVSDDMQDLPITVFCHSLLVHRGKRHVVTSLLEKAGYQVTQLANAS